MGYVFFGGMRGTAWVNTVQTSMFLIFGTIAFAIIAHGIGGFGNTVRKMADTLKPPEHRMNMTGALSITTAPATAKPPPDGAVLIRGKINPDDPNAIDRISKGYWFSYGLIPLSSIMFPHIAI